MRALFSFWYYENWTPEIGDYIDQLGVTDAFADSGAFTAAAQGSAVDLDRYIAWLARWQHRFGAYCGLDVIGDPDATWANQQAMEAEGLTPVPTFHVGEDWEWLKRYCDRYDYIALGGMVPWSGVALARWVLRCFQIGRVNGTRFHAFGVASRVLLDTFGWYSFDNSGWISIRFGKCWLWERGCLRQVTLGDWKDIYAHGSALRALGVDPAALAPRHATKVKASATPERAATARLERYEGVKASVRSWLAYEQHLQARHHVAPPAGRSGVGPKFYFVDTGPTYMPIAAEVCRQEVHT